MKFRKELRAMVMALRNRHALETFVQTREWKEGVIRNTGHWNHADIERLTGMVKEVTGDFLEIGVFRGDAFTKIVAEAQKQGRQAHAIDSFVGMADPGPKDGPGYPKGKFDVGGEENFRELMDAKGLQRDAYSTWAGYIPDCFDKIDHGIRFAFSILDVDHYEPTREGLKWLWPRISPGGIVALDDFLPQSEQFASLAIKEFLREATDFHVIDFFNQQLILKKLGV